jgi:Uma2 family endonuclease
MREGAVRCAMRGNAMFTQQPVWGETYLVSATMTGEDVLRLPDDGRKYELFEGVLVQDAMATPKHGIICQRLGGMLGMYAIQHQFTNTILQNGLFDLTPPGAAHRTVLAPDISIMRGVIAAATNVTTDIPLIAIEVLSSS